MNGKDNSAIFFDDILTVAHNTTYIAPVITVTLEILGKYIFASS